MTNNPKSKLIEIANQFESSEKSEFIKELLSLLPDKKIEKLLERQTGEKPIHKVLGDLLRKRGIRFSLYKKRFWRTEQIQIEDCPKAVLKLIENEQMPKDCIKMISIRLTWDQFDQWTIFPTWLKQDGTINNWPTNDPIEGIQTIINAFNQ